MSSHYTSPEQSKPDIGAIWVGYLHPDITMKELVGHFEHCGEIWQAKIMRTTKSVHPFAFLWFTRPNCAKRALDMDRSVLRNVAMKVRFKRLMEGESDAHTSPYREREREQTRATRFLHPYGPLGVTPPPPPRNNLTDMVRVIDSNHVRMVIPEGSNIARELSALEPIHVVNPAITVVPHKA